MQKAVCFVKFLKKALAVLVLIVSVSGCETLPDPAVYGERFSDEELAAALPGPVRINEVMLKNDSLLEADDHTLPAWLELAAASEKAVDIEGWKLVFFLKDGTQQELPRFPAFSIRPGDYPVIMFVPTGSTLSVKSIRIFAEIPENTASIVLKNAEGVISDRFVLPEPAVPDKAAPPVRNISLIRDPEFPSAVRIADNPTPGLPNDVRLPVPEFAEDSGFFAESAALDFTNAFDYPGWEIRYTINDGMEFNANDRPVNERTWIYPTNVSGTLFDTPREIGRTGAVKARFYSPTGAAGPIAVRTYFIGEETELPVFSITMDPDDLWGTEYGIHAIGDDTEAPNFREKWFRMAHMEFFRNTSREQPDLRDIYLLRLYGSSSRGFPLKSFALYAKEPASEERIPNHFFFEGSAGDVPDFYSIVLRSSGGDAERTLFRDGMMAGLATGYDVDKQDFQPSVVFLNGQYWGILNIREKINEYFLEDNHGIDPDAVDVVEGAYSSSFQINEGDAAGSNELLALAQSLPSGIEPIIQKAEDLLDIDSMIDYFIFQSFYNNTDWPWSNAKFWRSVDDEVKWRWILYDTDAGFDTTGYWTGSLERVSGTPDFNSFTYLLGEEFNNDLFSSLFKNLMKQEVYFNRMVFRYEELLETVFTTENLLQAVERHAVWIEDEIARHIGRWQGDDPESGWYWNLSEERWQREVEILREFARLRPGYVTKYLEELKAGFVPSSADRIPGGDFENGAEKWNLAWSQDSVEQKIITLDTGSKGGYLKILEQKTQFWDSVAFVQDALYVGEREEFVFSFDVKTAGISSQSKEIMVILFAVDTGPEVFNYTFRPTSVWKKIRIPVSYTGPELVNGRLQFRVGQLAEGQEVFIDNVRLE